MDRYRPLFVIGGFCGTIAVCAVVAGFSLLDFPSRGTLAGGAAHQVERGTGQSVDHGTPVLPQIPTPAKSGYIVCPIEITVQDAPATAARTTPEKTAVAAETSTAPAVDDAELSAAVYGAPWCVACPRVHAYVNVLRSRRYNVEYRDYDVDPAPAITILPTLFVYRGGQLIAKVEGADSILSTLRSYFP